jgi:hypothetical protein
MQYHRNTTASQHNLAQMLDRQSRPEQGGQQRRKGIRISISIPRDQLLLIIQQSNQFNNTTLASQPFSTKTTNHQQWLSSRPSSSPPWPLLPSPLPRAAPLTATRRSTSTPSPASPSVATARSSLAATRARNSSASTASASPSVSHHHFQPRPLSSS